MIDKAYFILGSHYVRYDPTADSVDPGYPKPIAGNWGGVADIQFDSDLDVTATWANGKVYFFKGDRYARYDIASNRIDPGYPLPIADNWAGLGPAGFASNLSAAIDWGNGKAYFFKNDRYLRYDIAADRIDDGFPRAIADGWPGFAGAGFGSDIRAAINWGNGKAYFFKADRYLRYDITADRIDDGFPRAIAEGWPSLARVGFGAGLAAAWVRQNPFAHLTDQFFVDLRALCGRLGCSLEDLLGVMESESSVNPSRQNPNGKATGLIQFMPDTLRLLGWSTGPDAFAMLTAEQQLPYVERFFAPNARFGLGSAGRLYQANFLPATLPGSTEATVLCGRDGPNAGIYRQNAVLDVNNDGQITVSDLTARVDQVRRGERWSMLMRRLAAT
jgi:Hemopexin